ncbi:hypothetical protein [Candidatus Nanohalobium constans]|nr:hypothetical protein [Candidatus Nanohalobium constans]
MLEDATEKEKIVSIMILMSSFYYSAYILLGQKSVPLLKGIIVSLVAVSSFYIAKRRLDLGFNSSISIHNPIQEDTEKDLRLINMSKQPVKLTQIDVWLAYEKDGEIIFRLEQSKIVHFIPPETEKEIDIIPEQAIAALVTRYRYTDWEGSVEWDRSDIAVRNQTEKVEPWKIEQYLAHYHLNPQETKSKRKIGYFNDNDMQEILEDIKTDEE